MKPDKKYMSMTDEENEFEPFEVPNPYNNLNGWAPIINIDNINTDSLNNYISSKVPYSLGSQINLSDENIDDNLRSSSELYIIIHLEHPIIIIMTMFQHQLIY